MKYLQINLEFNDDINELPKNLMNELEQLMSKAKIYVMQDGFDPTKWTTDDIREGYYDLYGEYPNNHTVDEVVRMLYERLDGGRSINWNILENILFEIAGDHNEQS